MFSSHFKLLVESVGTSSWLLLREAECLTPARNVQLFASNFLSKHLAPLPQQHGRPTRKGLSGAVSLPLEALGWAPACQACQGSFCS
jgi:hypothetical protein